MAKPFHIFGSEAMIVVTRPDVRRADMSLPRPGC